MFGEIELGVYAVSPIVFRTAKPRGTLTVYKHRPYGRSLENVFLDPRNSKLLTRNKKACVRNPAISRLYLKKTDIVTADLSGDFRSVVDRDRFPLFGQTYLPGEKQLICPFAAKKENPGVLQKEITFLRKKDGK